MRYPTLREKAVVNVVAGSIGLAVAPVDGGVGFFTELHVQNFVVRAYETPLSQQIDLRGERPGTVRFVPNCAVVQVACHYYGSLIEEVGVRLECASDLAIPVRSLRLRAGAV